MISDNGPQTLTVELYSLIKMKDRDRYTLEMNPQNRKNDIYPFESNLIDPEKYENQYICHLQYEITNLPFQFNLKIKDRGTSGWISKAKTNIYSIERKYQSGRMYPCVYTIKQPVFPTYFLDISESGIKEKITNDNNFLLDLAYYLVYFEKNASDQDKFIEFYRFFLTNIYENKINSKTLSKNHLDGFFDILDKSKLHHTLSFEALCAILITIGCLPPNGQLYVKKFEILTWIIDKLQSNIKHIITIYKNIFQKKFDKQFIRAIAISLYIFEKLELMEKKEEILILLIAKLKSLLPEKLEHEFIEVYIELWKTSKSTKNFQLFEFLIENYSSNQNIILELLSISQDNQAMMKALSQIVTKSTTNNHELAKKIINIYKNNSKAHIGTIELLKQILEETKEWNEFYARQLLEDIKDKYIICYKKPYYLGKYTLRDALTLIELALKYPHMKYIRDEKGLNKFIIQILNWGVDLTDIFSKLVLTLEQMSELLEFWVFSIFQDNRYTENAMDIINKILSALQPIFESMNYSPVKLIEAILKQLLQKGLKEFASASVINTIDQSISDYLKKSYLVKFEEKIIMPFTRKMKIQFGGDNPYDYLARLSYYNRDNKIILDLLEKFEVDVTEESVIQNIIESPTEQNTWLIMLQSDHSTKCQLLLSENIMILYQKIHDFEIPLELAVRINSMTFAEMKICIEYFNCALKVLSQTNPMQQSILEEPKMVIKRLCAEIKKRNTQKDYVIKFLDDYREEIIDIDQLIAIFDEFFQDYSKIPMKFEYPDKLKPIAKIAQEYNDLLISKPLLQLFKSSQNNEQTTSNTFIEILINVKAKFELSVHEIIEKNTETKMVTVIELFERAIFSLDRIKLDNEINIMKKLLSTTEEKRYFEELILKGSAAKSKLSICDNILSFMRLYNATDTPGLAAHCQNYCDLYPNISNMTIHEFIMFDDKIEIIKNEKPIYYIMKALCINKKFIEFILVTLIHVEDVDNLREGVNDYDESLIQTQTVNDLINVWYFIHEFQKTEEYEEKKQIMIKLYKERAEFKRMKEMISGCQMNLVALNTLYREILQKDEANKQTMILIIENSELKLIKSLVNIGKWDVTIKYKSKNTKQLRTLYLSNLLELRNRALLILTARDSISNTEQSTDSEKEKEKIEEIMRKIRLFIIFVNLINSLIQARNELYLYGYPFFEDEEQSPIFTCNKGNFQKFEENENNLKETLNKWKIHLTNLLIKFPHYSISYLHGQRFWEVEAYFACENKENNAGNILQFIGKELANNTEDVLRYPKQNTTDAFARISALAEYMANYKQNVSLPTERIIFPRCQY